MYYFSIFHNSIFLDLKTNFNHLENTLIQTNYGVIICHVFNNVNTDIIPTGKPDLFTLTVKNL
jgi:hypothetical protein